MNFNEAYIIETPDGAALNLRRQASAPRPKATVQICHGFAEHSARYAPFAIFLAEHGYHVFAHDHRGHGHTRADHAPRGRFALKDGKRRVVDDVLLVQKHIRKTYPEIPIILFGHSMGGMIAINVAEDNPQIYQGLAIWNSKLNPGMNGAVGLFLLKAERFFKGSDIPSQLGPKLTFDLWNRQVGKTTTPFDWLSHDQNAVQDFIDDPACGFDASVSMWIDVTRLAIEGGQKERIDSLPSSLPIHLVGGGSDPSTNGGRDVQWLADRLKSLGKTRVTVSIFEEMRHETLNEIGRHEAMKNFLAWADENFLNQEVM